MVIMRLLGFIEDAFACVVLATMLLLEDEAVTHLSIGLELVLVVGEFETDVDELDGFTKYKTL